MEKATPQQLFFKQIKTALPSHMSLADEIAELLGISNDSAYRRIRGEKPISLDEAQTLCAHFRISLDQVINIDSDSIVFFGPQLGQHFDLEKYLDYLLTNLKQIGSAQEKMFYYEAKDLPLFHHFQFEELAIFKFFFWMKTALALPGYGKMQFEDNDLAAIVSKKGPEILRTYNRIPTTEIWSIDTLNATVRQIEYYSYTGVFKKKDTAVLLYDQLSRAVDHIKEEAECGEKFSSGLKPQGQSSNFQLYYNEWFLGHNSMLVEADGSAIVYLNHSVMNQVATRDKAFCDFVKGSLTNIIKKSLLISSVGEKERNRFFNRLQNIIAKMKSAVI
jgi:hypothetical protein